MKAPFFSRILKLLALVALLAACTKAEPEVSADSVSIESMAMNVSEIEFQGKGLQVFTHGKMISENGDEISFSISEAYSSFLKFLPQSAPNTSVRWKFEMTTDWGGVYKTDWMSFAVQMGIKIQNNTQYWINENDTNLDIQITNTDGQWTSYCLQIGGTCGGCTPFISLPAPAFTTDLNFPVVSGTQTASLVFQNAALNTSACLSDTIKFDVDDATMTLSAPPTAAVIDANSYSVSGTCATSENATFHLKIQNMAGTLDYYSSAIAVGCVSNTYQLAPVDLIANAVPDGDFRVLVTATEPSGRVTTADSVVTLDTVVPTIAFDSADIASLGTITNDPGFSVDLTGTYDVARYIIVAGNAASCPAPTMANYGGESGGTSPVTITASYVSDGQKTICAIGSDNAGNISSLISHSFVWDQTAPTLSISFNSGNAYTNTDLISVGFTTSEPLSLVEISNSSCATGFADPGVIVSPFSHSFPAPDGTKTAYVRVTDLAGNISACASDSIIRDTTPPSGTISWSSNVDVNDETLYGVVGFDLQSPDAAGYQLTYGSTTCGAGGSMTTFNPGTGIQDDFVHGQSESAGPSPNVLIAAKLRDEAGNEACIFNEALFTYLKPDQKYKFNSRWGQWTNIPGETVCTGAETDFDDCKWTGDQLQVATAEASCSGLSLVDNLGVMDWECDDGSSRAVFTSKLKATKTVRDLINFATPAWNSFSVTLSGGISGNSQTSEMALNIWEDVVQDLPSSSAAPVQLASGNLYVVESVMTNQRGWYTSAGSSYISVVSAPGVPIAGFSGSCQGSSLFNNEGQYTWLTAKINTSTCSGTVSAVMGSGLNLVVSDSEFTTDLHGIYLDNQKFSLVKNLKMYGSNSIGYGVYLNGSGFGLFFNVEADSFNSGAFIETSDFNRFYGLKAARNTLHGLRISNSVSNHFHATTVSNNVNGVSLIGANHNSITKLLAVSNSAFGVDVTNGTQNSHFVNMTLVGNGVSGLKITGSSNSGNTFHNIAAFQNSGSGSQSSIDLGALSDYNTFSQILVSSQYQMFKFYDPAYTSNAFLGQIGVSRTGASSCVNNIGTLINCSSFTPFFSSSPHYSLSALPEFIGALTGSAGNPADGFQVGVTNDGSAAFNSINLMTSFAHGHRTYARSYSPLWEIDSFLPQPCISGDTCHIHDWRLKGGSSDLFFNRSVSFSSSNSSPSFPTMGACPVTGAQSLTESRLASPSTYLIHAVELTDPRHPGYTGTGDFDGLCDAGESCIYSPHVGSYQGEGAPRTCTFDDGGGITGIALWGYPSHGATPGTYQPYPTP